MALKYTNSNSVEKYVKIDKVRVDNVSKVNRVMYSEQPYIADPVQQAAGNATAMVLGTPDSHAEVDVPFADVTAGDIMAAGYAKLKLDAKYSSAVNV